MFATAVDHEHPPSVTITDSTLDANQGAGLELGYGARATLTRSTVSNNVPLPDIGEPVPTHGTGVYVGTGSAATINAATIAGNTANGVLVTGGSAVITHSTIVATTAPKGDANKAGKGGLEYGGVVVHHLKDQDEPQPGATATATPAATIVAANTTLPDCAGTITDTGNNLDSDGTCRWHAAGSGGNADARLGTLADNGGPTKSMLPATGSQALDAIPTGTVNCTPAGTDQRGQPRPAGPRCDIGAAENAHPTELPSPTTAPPSDTSTTAPRQTPSTTSEPAAAGGADNDTTPTLTITLATLGGALALLLAFLIIRRRLARPAG